MSRAILTCCVCFTRAEVPADLVVNGDDLETWWLLRRRQTCADCYRHTCWVSMVPDTFCFSDLDHPGEHRPWKDEYGDTSPEIPPIKDLWVGWSRRVHVAVP